MSNNTEHAIQVFNSIVKREQWLEKDSEHLNKIVVSLSDDEFREYVQATSTKSK